MKKLLIYATLVLMTSACGIPIIVDDTNRTINNFRYDNGKVTWSYVYHMEELDSSNVHQWFLDNFDIRNDEGNKVIGQSFTGELPIREAGLQRGNTVMMFLQPCIVYFTAEFKDNRYRVIVNEIIWNVQAAVSSNNVTFGAGSSSLSEVATKGQGYNSTFYNYNSDTLNKLLFTLFNAE